MSETPTIDPLLLNQSQDTYLDINLTSSNNTQPILRRQAYYLSDINFNYGADSNGLIVYDIQDINNKIFNVLLTSIGERTFEPEFGSILPELVWEPMDALTAWRLETGVFQALDRWIPEIQTVYGATSVQPAPDKNGFDVTIAYRVLKYNINASVQALLTR